MTVARLRLTALSTVVALTATLALAAAAAETRLAVPVGELRASIGTSAAAIEILPLDPSLPCRAVELSVVEPVAPASSYAEAEFFGRLLPAGCLSKTDYYVRHRLQREGGEVETLGRVPDREAGTFRFQGATRRGGRYEATSTLESYDHTVAGEWKRVRFSPAPAARIAFVVPPGERCTGVEFRWRSSGNPLQELVSTPGSTHDLVATPTPYGCVDEASDETPAPRFSVAAPEIAVVSPEGRVELLAPGETRVRAEIGPATGDLPVRVVPPGPCVGLSATYFPRRLSVGGHGIAPSLYYAPAIGRTCTRPDGAPSFASLTLASLAVDPVSGAVLALGATPSPAEVQVRHGPLTTVGHLWITTDAKEVCTSFSFELAASTVRAGEAIAIGSLHGFTHDHSVGDGLVGCALPPGEIRLTATPVDLVERGSTGGLVAAAEGEAEIFATIGALRADKSQPVRIGAAGPCRTMTARFDPPDVPVGQRAQVNAQYGPEPCTPPPGALAVGGNSAIASPVEPDTMLATGAGAIDVPIVHGALRATARLTVHTPSTEEAFRGDCQTVELEVSPKRIKVGEVVRVRLRREPAGCGRDIVVLRAEAITDDPDWATRVALIGVGAGGSEYQFRAHTAGGEIFFAAHRGRGGSLRDGLVQGDDIVFIKGEECGEMRLRFEPAVLTPGDVARPIIDFLPPGCRRPHFRVGFEIFNEQAVRFYGDLLPAYRAALGFDDLKGRDPGHLLVGLPGLLDVEFASIRARVFVSNRGSPDGWAGPYELAAVGVVRALRR